MGKENINREKLWICRVKFGDIRNIEVICKSLMSGLTLKAKADNLIVYYMKKVEITSVFVR